MEHLDIDPDHHDPAARGPNHGSCVLPPQAPVGPRPRAMPAAVGSARAGDPMRFATRMLPTSAVEGTIRTTAAKFMIMALPPNGFMPSGQNLPTDASLNPRLLHRLCRNWKNSQGGEICSPRTLERGRWGLAKYRAVGSGEASELRKTETVGDLCNVHRIGISMP